MSIFHQYKYFPLSLVEICVILSCKLSSCEFKMVTKNSAGQGLIDNIHSMSIIFLGKASTELLSMLVDSVCLLLTSKAREVVEAALGSLKVMLTILPVTTVAQFLKQIVSIYLKGVGMNE